MFFLEGVGVGKGKFVGVGVDFKIIGNNPFSVFR